MTTKDQNQLPPAEFCEFCGGPEPCEKRACLEALSAQADYYEGMITGSDWAARK